MMVVGVVGQSGARRDGDGCNFPFGNGMLTVWVATNFHDFRGDRVPERSDR